MSDPSKHPGQGFVPVKGYVPPAGTQAEQARRQEDADNRKRQQDQQDATAKALTNASGQKQPAGGCLVFIVAGMAMGLAAAKVAWTLSV
jgi:hypothetical protein